MAPRTPCTAAWDLPRNASTTTLYLPNAETISEVDLIAHLESEPRLTGPCMTGVQIHTIHSRKPGYNLDGPSICCLISWANRGVRRQCEYPDCEAPAVSSFRERQFLDDTDPGTLVVVCAEHDPFVRIGKKP